MVCSATPDLPQCQALRYVLDPTGSQIPVTMTLILASLSHLLLRKNFDIFYTEWELGWLVLLGMKSVLLGRQCDGIFDHLL